jgi:hypothetical protein
VVAEITELDAVHPPIHGNSRGHVAQLAQPVEENILPVGSQVMPNFVHDSCFVYKRIIVKCAQRPAARAFVPGIANALPVRPSAFDFLRSRLAEVLPGVTSVAAGTAPHQVEAKQWCLEAGSHCCTAWKTSCTSNRRARRRAMPNW